MSIDLHTHSTRSDGVLTPTELVDRAVAVGTRCLALTDHDSVEGLPEAFAAARSHPGFELIPGVELSVDLPNGEIHLLGYFIDWEDGAFRQRLQALQASRVGRARQIVARLTQLGAPITFDRVAAIAGDAAIGRPHLAQALLEAGHVRDLQEAFDRFLARGRPAHFERVKLSLAEAIALIAAAGGVAVLAHPGEAGKDLDLEAALREMVDQGLAGMEVYYGSYPQEKRARLLALAQRFGLIPCGGSDYHGRGNWFEGPLGADYTPAAALDALRTRARGARTLRP